MAPTFRKRALLAGTVLAALACGGLSSARASVIVYNLATSNLGAGFTGPFVQVTVDLTSATTAHLTYDSLTNGGHTYELIGTSLVDANVNAASWTISGFSATAAPGSTGSTATMSATSMVGGTVDGFGNFNQTVDNFDGPGSGLIEADFTLTNTGGTWASASQVLTPNGKGQILAANIAACTAVIVNAKTDCGGAAGLPTGFASGATPVVVVPEPGSVLVLGMGFLGTILLRNRSRRRKPVA